MIFGRGVPQGPRGKFAILFIIYLYVSCLLNHLYADPSSKMNILWIHIWGRHSWCPSTILECNILGMNRIIDILSIGAKYMANNKEIDKQTKNIYRQSVKQIYRHYMTHKCSDLQKRLYEKTAEIKYAQKIKTYF